MAQEKVGWIELITGPTLAGKTEELIRRIKLAEVAGLKTQVFKHPFDRQRSLVNLQTEGGAWYRARLAGSSAEIRVAITSGTEVVAIDGAQFFDLGVVSLVEELANRGLRVIVAGLDMDFRGEPFEQVARIGAQAEKTDKLLAVCIVCGSQRAGRTQRLINGEPAPVGDKRIRLTGDGVRHEPRCRRCHQVPGKEGS